MKHNFLGWAGLAMVAGAVITKATFLFRDDFATVDLIPSSIHALTGFVIYFGATIADRLTPKTKKVEYHINANANAAEAIDAVIADIRKRRQS